MQEGMKFETCHVRAPDKRRKVVNTDIANWRASGRARNFRRMNPSWRVFGCVLFIEGFPTNTVWETLHGDGTPGKVRKQPFRNPDVVVNHVGFTEPCPRIEDLVEI